MNWIMTRHSSNGGSLEITIKAPETEFKEFQILDAVQTLLVPFEFFVFLAGAKLQPVFGGSATRFKFFKVGRSPFKMFE